MKIAHLSDIHWTLPVPARRLLGKRLLSLANQIIGGRKSHYDLDSQRSVVQAVLSHRPDLVIISGDLTTTSLEDEFLLARDELRPLLDAFPTFMVPGNHDVYTVGARDTQRFERYFSSWSFRDKGAPIGQMNLDALTLIGLDTNRPGLAASGYIPDAQITALREALQSERIRQKPWILVMHHPVIGPDGALYDGWGHGLVNAEALQTLLSTAERPPLAILHGHRHKGYEGTLVAGEHQIRTYNCGSSGYSYSAEHKRAGGFNLYDLNGSDLSHDSYRYNGTCFVKAAIK